MVRRRFTFNLHYLKNIDRVSYLTEHLYFYRRGILSTVNSFKEGVFFAIGKFAKTSDSIV